MSDPKNRREIELIVEALDDVHDEEHAQQTVRRLGIDVESWASDIRARVAKAAVAARKQVFAQAKANYEADVAGLVRRPAEPARALEEQRQVFKALMARAPASSQVALNFHKFEKATPEELAEMIRALRHLLGEDEE